MFPVQHTSVILGGLQMKWMTVSNWLFSLIWDQSLPYELRLSVEGKIERNGNLISQVYRKVQASIACGQCLFLHALVMSVCYALLLLLHLFLMFPGALSQEYSDPAGPLKCSPLRPLKLISHRRTTNRIQHDTHVHTRQ